MHEAPWGEEVTVGVYVAGADATLEHLTLAFDGEYLGLLLDGGAPLVEDVVVTGNDIVMPNGEPTFRETRIDSYFAVRGASPTVEDSEILGHASVDGPGRTVIRRSTLHGGTSASAEATGAYEDNLFIGGQLAVDTGSDMLVTGNTVRDILDDKAAILVVDEGSSAEIVGNTVEGAAIGISVDSRRAGVERHRQHHPRRTRRHPRGVRRRDAHRGQRDHRSAHVRHPAAAAERRCVVGNRICDTEQAFELRGGRGSPARHERGLRGRGKLS